MIIFATLAAAAAAIGIAAGRLLSPAVNRWAGRAPERLGPRPGALDYRVVVGGEDAGAAPGGDEKTAGGCGGIRSAGGFSSASSNASFNTGRAGVFFDAPDAVGGVFDDFATGFTDPSMAFASAIYEGFPVTNALMQAAALDNGNEHDPIFQTAVEVSREPDLARYNPGQVASPAPRAAQGPQGPQGPQVSSSTIRRGILAAWREQSNDPVTWSEIPAGEYRIMVTNEPISVEGVRLPTSFRDQIAIAKSMGALPLTVEVSDARWANAVRRIPFQMQHLPGAARGNDPGQILSYNEKTGPNQGVLTDGFWKETVLSPKLVRSGRGSMAQYGFRNQDGSTVQHGAPGAHDDGYADYSNTPTYMSRKAKRGNVEVDLLDELAAGSAIGGPLPAWLVEKLR